MKAAYFLFTIYLFFVSLPTFAGNGLMVHGYGKNASMGGAGIAHPQDAISGAVNPAGTAWVGNRIDLTGDLYFLDGGYQISNGNRNPADVGSVYQSLGIISDDHPVEKVPSRKKNVGLPAFGLAMEINQQLSAGVTFYGTGLEVEYDRDETTRVFPNSPLGAQLDDLLGRKLDGTFFDGSTGVELRLANSNWHLSYKIMDNISIGAGVNLAVQSFRAKGVSALKFISIGNIEVGERDIDFAAGWNLGVQAEVIPNLTFAAAYYSRLGFSHKKYDGLFEGGNLPLPANWTAGLSLRLSEQHIINFDIQRVYWSREKATGNKLTDIFNFNFDINQPLAFQTNFLINPFGSDKTPGFGFSDSIIYKLGYQFKLDILPTWTWRLGYSYQNQIIPGDGSLFAVLAPGTIKRHFTFGFSKEIGKQYEAGFTFVYAPKETVRGKNLTSGLDVYMQQTAIGFSLGMKW